MITAMVEPWRAIAAGVLLLASIMVLIFRRRLARAVTSPSSRGGDGNSAKVGRARAKVQGSPAAMVWNAAVLAAMAAMVFFGEQGRCWLRDVC